MGVASFVLSLVSVALYGLFLPMVFLSSYLAPEAAGDVAVVWSRMATLFQQVALVVGSRDSRGTSAPTQKVVRVHRDHVQRPAFCIVLRREARRFHLVRASVNSPHGPGPNGPGASQGQERSDRYYEEPSPVCS